MAGHVPERRLDWAPRALDAYLASLARIVQDDPHTALRFVERVESSLDLIRKYPSLGTAVLRRGERRFPIPGTGHVVHYRVTDAAVRILIWYRARQHVVR